MCRSVREQGAGELVLIKGDSGYRQGAWPRRDLAALPSWGSWLSERGSLCGGLS